MNRLLLIFVGLMCWTSVSFGQHSFEVPLSLNVFGETLAFINSPAFDFNTGVPDGKIESATVETYRLISSFKPESPYTPDVPDISFSEGSNMPIIDLSKGFASNFIIKQFSNKFLSRMPITELKSPNVVALPPFSK